MGNEQSGVASKYTKLSRKDPYKYLTKIMAEGGLTEKDLKCDVKQWVSRVIRFSSQYNSTTWSANCLIGKPRVYPKYGDIHGAWAQGTVDSNQFVELKFEEKVFIEKINIYETFHGGAVSCIKVRPHEGKWEAVWTAEEEDFDDITQSRIFSPTIKKVDYQCDEVRIEQNCQFSGTWCEIDAVQIVGNRYNFAPEPKLVDLATDLSSLVNNQQFSDATFMVEDTLFYAHKAILVVRSDYFRAMFCDQMREATTTKAIKFKDPGITKEAFLIMLHFIYTNKIPSDCACLSLAQVWRIADQFSLDALKALAIYEVNQRVDLSNVVDIYIDCIENLPVIENVKAICLNFMKNNMADVVRSPSFVNLPQEIMLDTIQLMTSKLSIK